jgi:hypothetical protein
MDELDLLHELSSDSSRSTVGETFFKKVSSIKCKNCDKPADKALMWAEHRAYVPSCDGCLETVKKLDCFKDGGLEAVKDIQYIIEKRKKRLEKKAASGELIQHTAQFLKSHSKEIAGALVGAALAGGAQYMANKPGKDGKKSLQQKLGDESVKATKDSKSFSGQVAHASAKAVKEVSDLFAKHPVKGALTMIPTGAAGGVAVAKLLTKK